MFSRELPLPSPPFPATSNQRSVIVSAGAPGLIHGVPLTVMVNRLNSKHGTAVGLQLRASD
jgi:hypothetical protein